MISGLIERLCLSVPQFLRVFDHSSAPCRKHSGIPPSLNRRVSTLRVRERLDSHTPNTTPSSTITAMAMPTICSKSRNDGSSGFGSIRRANAHGYMRNTLGVTASASVLSRSQVRHQVRVSPTAPRQHWKRALTCSATSHFPVWPFTDDKTSYRSYPARLKLLQHPVHGVLQRS